MKALPPDLKTTLNILIWECANALDLWVNDGRNPQNKTQYYKTKEKLRDFKEEKRKEGYYL
jgi:hypothetical protein